MRHSRGLFCWEDDADADCIGIAIPMRASASLQSEQKEEEETGAREIIGHGIKLIC
jgi:hypothetical protein